MNATMYNLEDGLKVHFISKADTDIVYQEIFREDVYRRHGISIKSGDCIVDVGANTGLFLLFLNRICQSARVIAVEPIPDIFEVLQRNLADHNHLDVTALNVGLSSESGTTDFTYFPRISCASTMYPDNSDCEARRAEHYIIGRFKELPNRLLSVCLTSLPNFMQMGIAKLVRKYYAKKQVIRCELRTLSELIQSYDLKTIDFLKLDAERSELAILNGIEDSDWQKIQQTVVEVHEGDEACQQVLNLLESRGFSVNVDHNPEFNNIYMLYGKKL